MSISSDTGSRVCGLLLSLVAVINSGMLMAAEEDSLEPINDSIARGVGFLIAKQNQDGSWEGRPKPRASTSMPLSLAHIKRSTPEPPVWHLPVCWMRSHQKRGLPKQLERLQLGWQGTYQD